MHIPYKEKNESNRIEVGSYNTFMAHQSPNKRIKCQTILGKHFSSALSHPFRLELLTTSLNLTKKLYKKLI